MAGREMSQKRKKLTQSAVVVPESSGNVLGIVFRSFNTVLAFGYCLWKWVEEITYPAFPDGPDHQINTPPADIRLNAVPDTGHSSPVEHGPERTPDTEGGTVNDREANVICRTNSSREADEARSDGVADPDAEP